MKQRALLALLARLFVGAVLVYAGASKASAPAEEFALVIGSYDLVPNSIALPMAGLLPWLELLVGWALILGVRTKAASAIAGAMTCVFLLAIASVIIREIPLPNCGCFGEGMHFSPAHAFIIDSLLTFLCWIAYSTDSNLFSLDSWTERGI